MANLNGHYIDVLLVLLVLIKPGFASSAILIMLPLGLEPHLIRDCQYWPNDQIWPLISKWPILTKLLKMSMYGNGNIINCQKVRKVSKWCQKVSIFMIFSDFHENDQNRAPVISWLRFGVVPGISTGLVGGCLRYTTRKTGNPTYRFKGDSPKHGSETGQ